MQLDRYSNPVFNEKDLFDALYQGYQLSVNDTLIVDHRSEEIKQLEQQLGFKFLEPYETHFELSDYDRACQSIWNMPDEYKQMDIEEFLINSCPPENYQRVIDELDAFKERNMLDLLRWLKYFVDTMRSNNHVWGVGRGSSVASYVLFLIGVHKIDSLKYNLDWQDFLR
jgi:DNA polymerase III alpha subunit